MSQHHPAPPPPRSANAALRIGLAMAAALPALALRFHPLPLGPLLSILIFGGAVVGASFLLAWAAEAAHADISGSLATALLSLVAVLPEYAVDLLFAHGAGSDPHLARFAAANMTGSNRLLLGLGWPLVLLLLVLGRRSRQEPAPQAIDLAPQRRLDLAVLGVSALYGLGLPLRHQIGLVDGAALLGLFAFYLWRAAGAEGMEHPAVGTAAALEALPAQRRRPLLVLLFLFAAAVILAAAHPFADALVDGGRALGLDEFLLVQWLAPLASEAPEFLVAAVLALRGDGESALGTLLSAKVNQWTLLVGSLPVAFAVGGGSGGLPLDARQIEEVALTAAQTLLGFSLLCGLRLGRKASLALALLFASQLCFPGREVRLLFAGAYLAASAVLLWHRRRHLLPLARALAGRAQ
jgi:cation:H+ antiporter